MSGTETGADRRWELLVNPYARRRGLKAGLVLEILRRRGVQAQVWRPGSAEEARETARKLRDQKVVTAVLGGDGTANDVGSQLVGGDAWLAALPGGTENLICRAAGASSNIREAVEQLLAGRPRRWDVGLLGDRFFLGFAGIGFDGEVCRRAEGPLRQRLGNIVYWAATAAHLARKPTLYDLKTEERTISGINAAIFSNIPLFGGGLKINPEASPADGALNAAIFPWHGYLARVRQLLSLLLDRPAPSRLGVLRDRLRQASVRANGRIQVQIDGDPAIMENPEIAIRPGALWVLEAGPAD